MIHGTEKENNMIIFWKKILPDKKKNKLYFLGFYLFITIYFISKIWLKRTI